MALFLSAFGLPHEINNRTIYTVVTKPISAGEIVLGRVVGFAAVGTAMIVAMGLVSYFFVVRGLSHDHAIHAADLTDIPPPEAGVKSPGKGGPTRFDAHHRHTLRVDSHGKPVVDQEGKARTSMVAGHWQEAEMRCEGA